MTDLSTVFQNNVLPWLTSQGLDIAGILIGALLVKKFSGIFFEKLIRRLIVSDNFSSKEAETKREDTLIAIVNGIIGVAVWLITGLMILQELGVAIGPVLAATGIVGLAFGFGGQYLIRDVISGLFIILENQYRVGDVVCFDKTCGLVENVSLRMTSLRDMDGTLHHIPHGEIKKVSNMTKNYSRVNLNIGVAYDSNMEKVIEAVNKVGKELSEESPWKDYITETPQFLRIDDFADSAIIIKIFGKTKPSKQWEVTGELRKRIKVAFDKEEIEIPFPQQVVHQAK